MSKQWLYELRWGNPHTQPTDPKKLVLLAQSVPPGAPAPPTIFEAWQQHKNYSISLTIVTPEEKIRRWSPEAKARNRRRRLKRRMQKHAPLFADELMQRELESRPLHYYTDEELRGKK